MQDIDLFEKSLLGKSVNSYTIPFTAHTGEAVFYIGGKDIDLDAVIRLISGIAHYVHCTSQANPILIIIKEANFDEKLLYILLECYLEHIIGTHNLPVRLIYDEKTNITTKGLLSMPLQLLKDGTAAHRAKFLRKFNSEIYKGHYRRVFEPFNSKNLESLSAAMTTIDMFLRIKGVAPEVSNEVAEVAVELVGNAIEHTDSHCLVDIDVADNYIKPTENLSQQYYGVNICVLNFSSILLGTGIQKKMCCNPVLMSMLGQAPRYEMLKKAYMNHQHFFGDKYTEDDFFMLSAFQNKISGRQNDNLNGGTGLPRVIQSLESRSDAHSCYVLSGKRVMKFQKDYLQYNHNQWIGMNNENDFIRHKPNDSVFRESPLDLPGTAYNLNFVLAKGE